VEKEETDLTMISKRLSKKSSCLKAHTRFERIKELAVAGVESLGWHNKNPTRAT
jgi:hypothetical protein